MNPAMGEHEEEPDIDFFRPQLPILRLSPTTGVVPASESISGQNPTPVDSPDPEHWCASQQEFVDAAPNYSDAIVNQIATRASTCALAA